MQRSTIARFVLTSTLVTAAATGTWVLWNRYMYSPWTRDGRVRADVIHVAPDVGGLVAEVRVADNQLVHKGDLLAVIDRQRYVLAVERARAELDVARANAAAAGSGSVAASASVASRKVELEMYVAQAARRSHLALTKVVSVEVADNAASASRSASATLSQAQATRQQADSVRQQAVASVELAGVALRTAELDLARTEVRAPADGFITNLHIRPGDYATGGAPILALIDRASFWVYGYFEETKLPAMHEGDRADVHIMGVGTPLTGYVSGMARGITDANNPTGADLLANVSPTFSWVRLAQRVPVRIELDPVPEGLTLSAGMTATVVVRPVAGRP